MLPSELTIMQLNSLLIRHIGETFTSFFKEETNISNISRIEGGDINQTFALSTNKGKFFLKLNSALFGHDFFEKEVKRVSDGNFFVEFEAGKDQ